MIARFAALLLLASVAAARDVGGVIEADTRWSGIVEIVEDVIVRPGVTLTIEPGTRVLVATDVKGEGQGWDPRSLEIHVYGRIVAHGTPSRRIRFGPPEAKPADEESARDPTQPDPTWMGFVFHERRTDVSRLIWCSIERARLGVQVVGRELIVEQSLFSRCVVGVASGMLRGENGKVRLDRGFETAPIFRSCLFAQCSTGLMNERTARPDLVRCVFLDCRAGLGFARIGDYSAPVEGVGTRLERCEFIRCGKAVASGARISNCIFEQNEVGIASSRGHAGLAIVVDRFRIAGVLADGNDVLFAGDLPPADGVKRAGARRCGELPTWKRYDPKDLWGPPMAERLALAEDSPARGAAVDGGDLGAFGRGRKSAPSTGAGKAKGIPLDSWLICGPPNAAGARDPDWPGRNPRCGMRGKDFVWIGVADALSEPRRPGGSLTSGPANPRYVVAHITVEEDRKLRLGIRFDGKASIWCDGRALLPTNAFGFAEERFIEFDATDGTNRLTLRLTPRYAGAPFRARLTDSHGDAPIGVACVSHQGRAKRFTVRPTKTKLEDNGTYTVTLRFSSPPHWDDAVDLENYSLETLEGRAFNLRCVRAEYDPRGATVTLHGVRPPLRDTLRIVVGPLRDTAGVRRAPDCKRARVKFR